MFQGLPITLLPVKVGNTSENLGNEIHQTIFFCIQLKKLIEKSITTPRIQQIYNTKYIFYYEFWK